MTNTTEQETTAEQLALLPDEGLRRELIAGELRLMWPSGWLHGRVVAELHGLLWRHIRGHRLGALFGAETGFLMYDVGLDRRGDT